MISGDVYLKPVLHSAPRLLGLLNRNISSKNYGCFDREYWHYNTVDIACARKQEAVLTLTLLYLVQHPNNKYYNSSELLEYIKAAMRFWTKIQNSSGSFNEWYPNEHSFVVTSFSLYAVSESLLLLKDRIPESEYRPVIDAIARAGEWLVGRNETRVMNQQTGAAVALLNVYYLTDEDRFLKASRAKIELLNQRQSNEGWFIEYGGPDMGYLSLGVDYLSKYFKKTEDDLVKDIVTRALSFLKYFIQPNLIAGGEYTSRNTEYLIPHGFEIFSRINNDACFISSVIRKSLINHNSFPNLFDDRYQTYVGYTWLQAYLDANPETDGAVDGNIEKHFENIFEKIFPESGLIISNDNYRHLVINTKKGGSFRLFDKSSGRAYSDSGIMVRSNNIWYTSGWLAESLSRADEGVISVSGTMSKVPDRSITPFRNILFRLFQITLGRWDFVSLWIKERLRDVLITKTKPSNIRYNRKMAFNSNVDSLLEIEDTVTSDAGDKISSVIIFSNDTHIYVPSSRYYVVPKDLPYREDFSSSVNRYQITWKINRGLGTEFKSNE